MKPANLAVFALATFVAGWVDTYMKPPDRNGGVLAQADTGTTCNGDRVYRPTDKPWKASPEAHIPPTYDTPSHVPSSCNSHSLP